MELADDVKATLGTIPHGFLDYFLSRFPRLLIHVHRMARETYVKSYILQRVDKCNVLGVIRLSLSSTSNPVNSASDTPGSARAKACFESSSIPRDPERGGGPAAVWTCMMMSGGNSLCIGTSSRHRNISTSHRSTYSYCRLS